VLRRTVVLPLGLMLERVTPDEEVAFENPSWIANVSSCDMDFAPGEHRFQSAFPSRCSLSLRMEAGHTYEVVGRTRESMEHGNYHALSRIRDRAPSGISSILEVPCDR